MNVMKFCVASAAAFDETTADDDCGCDGACSKVAGTPILRRSVAEGYEMWYDDLKVVRSLNALETVGFFRRVLYCPRRRRQVGVYLFSFRPVY